MSKYKNWLPHLIAFFVMMTLAFAYYAPALGGKVLNQSDNVQSVGAQTELRYYREKDGKQPLWTNSQFGGMPAYQILADKSSNWTRHLYNAFLFWQGILPPHTATLLLMVMMYVLMVALGVDWRLSLVGGVAFGLATNHVILFEAGHSTKIITTAYIPTVIAGVLLAFRGRFFVGGALVALGMAMQVLANHVQMTYYMVLLLVLLGGFELFWAIKDQQLPRFLKAVGVIAVAAVLGVLTNLSTLWTTYEFTAETIRGKSELTLPKPGADTTQAQTPRDGLTKDYAFNWSYGLDETFNLLVPNYKGGTSSYSFVQDQSSASFQALQQVIRRADQNQAQQVYQELAQQLVPYWGEQPFTSGPVYFGAVIVFLFVLGIIIVKDRLKWWLLAAFVLTLMIAWGKNLAFFNYLMFDYFPLFNKFRSVTMILGISNLLAIVLGVMALHEISKKGIEQSVKTKAVLLAGGIVGGLSLLIWVLGFGMLSFTRTADQSLDQFPELLAALQEDRAGLLRADALRSFAFVALATGALWLFVTKKIKWVFALVGVGLLVLIDLWGVNLRFLETEDFIEPTQLTQNIQPSAADNVIMIKDDKQHYRVLDFTRGSPFQSAMPSYFHRSIGGYSAAKLSIFQDLVDYYLFDPASSLHLYGMLNTKYFVQNVENSPRPMPIGEDLGNAWFVSEYQIVPNANEELKSLATLEPRNKAVIQQKYADYLKGLTLQRDSAATISLTSYHPDRMVYAYTTSSEQLAVFSEMYYPPSKGWNVYLDNKKVEPFVKANYAVRALRVPAGTHTLEMRFEPTSFYAGARIAVIASILVFVVFFGGLFLFFRNYQPDTEETIEIDDPQPNVKASSQPTRTKATVKKVQPKGRKK